MKSHTPEQVINKLREAEVAMAQGSRVAEASRQIGVTEQTLRLRSGQALSPIVSGLRVSWGHGRCVVPITSGLKHDSLCPNPTLRPSSTWY